MYTVLFLNVFWVIVNIILTCHYLTDSYEYCACESYSFCSLEVPHSWSNWQVRVKGKLFLLICIHTFSEITFPKKLKPNSCKRNPMTNNFYSLLWIDNKFSIMYFYLQEIGVKELIYVVAMKQLCFRVSSEINRFFYLYCVTEVVLITFQVEIRLLYDINVHINL